MVFVSVGFFLLIIWFVLLIFVLLINFIVGFCVCVMIWKLYVDEEVVLLVIFFIFIVMLCELLDNVVVN